MSRAETGSSSSHNLREQLVVDAARDKGVKRQIEELRLNLAASEPWQLKLALMLHLYQLLRNRWLRAREVGGTLSGQDDSSSRRLEKFLRRYLDLNAVGQIERAVRNEIPIKDFEKVLETELRRASVSQSPMSSSQNSSIGLDQLSHSGKRRDNERGVSSMRSSVRTTEPLMHSSLQKIQDHVARFVKQLDALTISEVEAAFKTPEEIDAILQSWNLIVEEATEAYKRDIENANTNLLTPEAVSDVWNTFSTRLGQGPITRR